MKTRSVLVRAAGLFFAAVVPSLASSQTTIQLEGMLKSTGGEAVSAATVTVTDPATNETRKASSTSTGQFRVLGLYPGRYTVSVRALGYAPASQDVELIIGQRANIVFTLEKAATELGTMEIRSGHMTNVEVQRFSVSAPVVREQILNLPTNDRNVMSLAAITPGIKAYAPSAGRGLPSAGAMPDLRFNNMYMDGIELKSLFNGNLVGEVVADEFRNDLLKLNKGDGHHAFVFVPPSGSYQPPLQIEVRAAKRKVLKAVTVEPPAAAVEPETAVEPEMDAETK